MTNAWPTGGPPRAAAVPLAGGPVAPGAERSCSEPGPLLFARFAYRPNALGYCGGDDAASLLQHVAAGVVDPDLVRLCREFDGAYPYLERIAADAGLPDPLDRRAVEAYWVGSPALARTAPRRLADDLERRFRGRIARREWPWLAAKPAAGALPHHSFHVLEVFPRVGLMRGGPAGATVPLMERCLVRPATVTALDGDDLLVLTRPLELRAGGLVFGASREERVGRRVDGLAAVATVAPGDSVAIHWGWACDRLDAARRRVLGASLARALALANCTL